MKTPGIQVGLRGGWRFPAGASWIAGLFLAVAAPADSPVSGVTRPVREARLSAASAGIVSKVAVREGDAVRKGDVLIELERRREELEAARRKLLWENPAELRAAEARRDTAKTDLEATRALFESTKSVSREELARKQMEHDVAAAECLHAQMNKQRERIEYDMAVEELERRTIRAPMDGCITEIQIKEGEGCEMRQPLISLADASEVEFSANVEAAVLARFSVGQVVELVLEDESGGDVRRQATIYHVAPVVDRASGLGLLKATFQNADRSIRPGVPARIATASP